MQRVRIGLTGLACVFVLVLLAAAFFGLARPLDDEPVGPPGDNAGMANQAATPEQPQEPLAELGVTPGGSADKDAPPAATNSVTN